MITTKVKTLIVEIDTKELGCFNGNIETYRIEFVSDEDNQRDKDKVFNDKDEQISNSWSFIYWESPVGLIHQGSWLYNHLIGLGITKKVAENVCQTVEDILFNDKLIQEFNVKV